jgi:hypothetical protein
MKFVGFMQFYLQFIPNFKTRIAPLQEIMLKDYTVPVGTARMDCANAAFEEMHQAILSDPVLQRYDHRKLLVLRTYFSADGFGYVACQPANNDVSLKAMNKQMRGGDFNFMRKTSSAILHPVAFGCQQTRGNKKRLHSHLGEGFSGDWSIKECRHMCFGQRFTWVTNCYAIKFILSYDSRNPAILRLQMHFMCWDMEIEHRNDNWLNNVDYFSRLGANLCYDPLLCDYIKQVNALRQKNPSPSELPMEPENMPYFRGPRVNTPSHYAAALDPQADASKKYPSALQILDAAQSLKCGLQHLSNWPVSFGLFTSAARATATGTKSLYNSDITAAASMRARFDWEIYGFNSGHFVSVMERGIQINVVLSSDPFANKRALFKQFTKCPTILSSAPALLDHVRGSGITSKLAGYMIHSHSYTTSELTTCF